MTAQPPTCDEQKWRQRWGARETGYQAILDLTSDLRIYPDDELHVARFPIAEGRRPISEKLQQLSGTLRFRLDADDMQPVRYDGAIPAYYNASTKGITYPPDDEI